MPVRYGRFEMPKTLVKDEDTATETYAKFFAEPFEAGYGHTVGNSLRRVLLSSLEGAAITALKITGAQHEFATLPGVVEDVTDIVLNLKKVKFKADDHEPRKLSLTVNKEGEVTAGDIQVVQGYDVLNPKQVIFTVDKKHKLDAELDLIHAHVEQLLELYVLFAHTGRRFVELDHVFVEVDENIEVMAQNRGGLEQRVLWGQSPVGPDFEDEFVIIGALTNAGIFDRVFHARDRRKNGIDWD